MLESCHISTFAQHVYISPCLPPQDILNLQSFEGNLVWILHSHLNQSTNPSCISQPELPDLYVGRHSYLCQILKGAHHSRFLAGSRGVYRPPSTPRVMPHHPPLLPCFLPWRKKFKRSTQNVCEGQRQRWGRFPVGRRWYLQGAKCTAIRSCWKRNNRKS